MDRQDFRDVMAMLAPLRRKLALVASRAVLTMVRDSKQMQGLQAEGLDGEVWDQCEHMQPGGITHVPLSGAEAIRLTLAGDYSNSVFFAASNREHRPRDLAPGETALYNAGDNKSTVIVRANGDVEVTLAAGAKLRVGGEDADYVALAAKVDAALDALGGHVHVAPSGGGNTGGPLASTPPNDPLVFESTAATLTLSE